MLLNRDVKLIDMLKLCPSPKPILTTYPGARQRMAQSAVPRRVCKVAARRIDLCAST